MYMYDVCVCVCVCVCAYDCASSWPGLSIKENKLIIHVSHVFDEQPYIGAMPHEYSRTQTILSNVNKQYINSIPKIY